MAEIHSSYMARLHEWQKICNFQYAMSWNYYGMQLAHATRHHATTAATARPGTTTAAPDSRRSASHGSQTIISQTREYTIAPISSRVMAELVDFLVLMLIKMAGIYLMMRFTGAGPMSISFNFLVTEEYDMEDDLTIEDLQSMVLVAFLYRLLACLYEALFISIQGATIGKQILGLEVVVCEASFMRQQADNQRVSLYPGGTPGFGNSWIRSMIKNFSIAFLMPAFLTVYFYQHNRASYDIVANTIVVKRR